MGISADDQERVFERFFRTDIATSRAVQGTGLGLAICQAIADSHNGTISVESQPSRGTTFQVRLSLRAEGSAVSVIVPAGKSAAGAGANPLDPAARTPAANASRAQGRAGLPDDVSAS